MRLAVSLIRKISISLLIIGYSLQRGAPDYYPFGQTTIRRSKSRFNETADGLNYHIRPL